MGITDFVVGTIAGAGADIVKDKVKDQITGFIPGPKDEWELFLGAFPTEWNKLLKNVEAMANSSGQGVIRTTQTLQPYPYEYTIQTYGRPHISIFTVASVQVRFFVAGVGIYIVTLPSGWSAVDFPDQSTIALPMGASGQQVVLIQASDASLGSAI